jgi:dATP pyrophosphohydrolase
MRGGSSLAVTWPVSFPMTSSTAPEQRPYKIPASVLVVIHTPDLQVLLLERADKPGFWQSVTGSKDALEEPVRETCIREVAEETGIVIGSAQVPASALSDSGYQNVYEIYPMWRHRYAPGVTRNTEHVFSLEVPADTPVTLAPREHLQFVWCPWAEAAERCFSPSNGEAIRRLAAARGVAP